MNQKYLPLEQINIEVVKKISEQDKNLYKLVKQVKHRTIPQNKLLHVYFKVISDRFVDLWDEMTPEILKEVLKQKLWIKFERKWEFYPKPTSNYTTVEMKEFINNMQIFCKDFLNFELPDPNNENLLNFYNDNY